MGALRKSSITIEATTRPHSAWLLSLIKCIPNSLRILRTIDERRADRRDGRVYLELARIQQVSRLPGARTLRTEVPVSGLAGRRLLKVKAVVVLAERVASLTVTFLRRVIPEICKQAN